MRTTFELIKATSAVIKGNKAAFADVLKLSINDMFFQTYFIVCDEAKTNECLYELYTKLLRNSLWLESADDAANWLNEAALEKTSTFLMKNRQDMIVAEKRGVYIPPRDMGVFTTGPELSDADYMKLLQNMICNLPEIHRQTAIAFYYDGMDIAKMSDIMMIDVPLLRKRIEFIEATLVTQMKDYCKQANVSYVTITPQRILAALNSLAEMYCYMDSEGLYNRICQK